MPPFKRSKRPRINKGPETELALDDLGAFFGTHWTDTFGAAAIRVFYVSLARQGRNRHGRTFVCCANGAGIGDTTCDEEAGGCCFGQCNM
jgi:hypothetical protein